MLYWPENLLNNHKPLKSAIFFFFFVLVSLDFKLSNDTVRKTSDTGHFLKVKGLNNYIKTED